MNQKNLNYEIETVDSFHRFGCGERDAMNQKNLNYEIETIIDSVIEWVYPL